MTGQAITAHASLCTDTDQLGKGSELGKETESAGAAPVVSATLDHDNRMHGI